VKRYGASGWHLMALLACFALTGYTVTRLLDDTSSLLQIVVWFVGAAVVWDLVLGPALALADRGLRNAVQRFGGVPALNYLRFPVGLSLLLLVVFAPLVFQRAEQRYRAKTGLTEDPYLERWAAVTAALFAASALAYGLAVLRARRA
jgi:hypothetical protein